MKIAICISGTTGSGKSTLVNALGRMGWRTFHTGDVFRNAGLTIVDGENPLAPERADGLIEEALGRFLAGVQTPMVPTFLALECLPRKQEQLTWVEMIQNAGFWPLLVHLTAPRATRLDRVVSRDACQTSRMSGDLLKIAAEEREDQFKFLQEKLPFPCIVCETASWDYSLCLEAESSALQRMLTMVRSVFDSHTGVRQSLPSVERAVERCREELHELQHAEGRHRQVGELVDSLWFILNAALALNVTHKELLHRFTIKYNINRLRLEQGVKIHDEDH